MGRIAWVRIAEYHDTVHSVLFLTPSPKRFNRHILFKYGVKQIHCITRQLVISEADDMFDSSNEEPATVFISTILAKDLRIPANLTFQLLLEDDRITIGPTIGLLVGSKKEKYSPEFMMENYADRMGVYHEIGGLIVAYSTMSVDWDRQTVDGLMYNPENNTWVPVETTIPSVTYRRHVTQSNFREFRKTLINHNGMLFNSIRYSKWKVHIFLAKNHIIKRYLPDTILLKSFNQFIEFIQRFNHVILKPKSGSRGKGILIIKRVLIDKKEKFLLNNYMENRGQSKPSFYSLREIRSFLDKLYIFESRKYICQRYINLATINGSFFDFRVIMQKSIDMNWRCTGIECRIADQKKEITNIAAGGKAMPIEETVNMLDQPIRYDYLYKSIINVCNEFCFCMDLQKGHRFAEFGIDIALGQDGKIWILEANFKPDFKGFKTFNHNLYLEIGYQPIRYATALQQFSVNENLK